MNDFNLNTLKKIFDEILGYDTQIKNINDETKLIDDLGFSSITLMELIVELEIQLGIEVAVEEFTFDNFLTVKQLSKLIDSKTNKG